MKPTDELKEEHQVILRMLKLLEKAAQQTCRSSMPVGLLDKMEIYIVNHPAFGGDG